MNTEKYTLASGKQICVFDDLLPLQLRDKLFCFINRSRFQLGWSDNSTEKAVKHKYLHSVFSIEDDENAGLLPFLMGTEIGKVVSQLERKKSIVNLSVPSDNHFVHAHPEKIVVLYYANMEWHTDWYGETLFYSEDLKNIELALPYTPGRVVVFDASIPHSIRPQSITADHYRFTYAMTFD